VTYSKKLLILVINGICGNTGVMVVLFFQEGVVCHWLGCLDHTQLLHYPPCAGVWPIGSS